MPKSDNRPPATLCKAKLVGIFQYHQKELKIIATAKNFNYCEKSYIPILTSKKAPLRMLFVYA
ncbi:MAG: hypothetical protein WCJ51_02670 [Candidatus Moraniibacteriota bacterium]